MMKSLRRKGFARVLKRQAAAMKYALEDPRTPRSAKVLGAAFLAYLLSPIDLIPDFIPVLGYLDDLIIVPAGLALAVRLVPDVVLLDCRARAAARLAEGRPPSMAAAAVIVCIWVASIALAGWLVWHVAARPAT